MLEKMEQKYFQESSTDCSQWPVLNYIWGNYFASFFISNATLLVSIGIMTLFTRWLWKNYSFAGTAEKRFNSMGFEISNGRPNHKDIINRYNATRGMEQALPPYPNSWFLLLLSEQLKRGKATEVCILGMNLVAWRGHSGKAYVADAYCPHLGAHLGVGGVVKGECISCPFHGWQFQGCDGALAKIPYANSEKVNAKIKMHTILEQQGLIYIWYHAEGNEPTWTPKLRSDNWMCKSSVQSEVCAHIQDIAENISDTSHFNVLHSPGFVAGFEPHNNPLGFLEFARIEYNGKWMLHDDPKEKHIGSVTMATKIVLFDKLKIPALDMTVIQEGPGITLFKFQFWFLKMAAYNLTTPLEPMTQRIVLPIFASRWMPSIITAIIFEYYILTVGRDVTVWNRKKQMKSPCFVKEDSGVKTFRSWVTQFYSKNSSKSCFVKNTSEF